MVQILRPAISVFLLVLVHKKISIGKWLFLLWCVPIFLVNSSILLSITDEYSKKHYGNVITVILLYGGYLIACYLTLLQNNKTLINTEKTLSE